MSSSSLPEEKILERVVVRMNAVATGVVLGLLFGSTLFVATNVLLLKDGEDPGPHLALLGQFFPGYTVSFVGSLIGFAYFFAVGFLSGWLLGKIYDRLVE